MFVATKRAPRRTASDAAVEAVEVEVAVPADDDRVGRAVVDGREPGRASASTTPGPAHASTARPARERAAEQLAPPPCALLSTSSGRRRLRTRASLAA